LLVIEDVREGKQEFDLTLVIARAILSELKAFVVCERSKR
jgi:hypothetical protein